MRLRRLTRSVLVVCAFAVALPAQNWISVGVKGGVPLTDAVADRTYSYVVATIPNPFGSPFIMSETRRISSGSTSLVLGPTLEVRLPFGLALEADALYRPLNINVQTSTSLDYLLGRLTLSTPLMPGYVDTWEFPLLAKYRLPVPFMKPYFAAGPVFRATTVRQFSHNGVAVGIGVEARINHFRLSPEIRYTHWGRDGAYPQPYYPVSYRNQLEFLAGVATASDSAARPGAIKPSRLISFGVKGGFPFTTAFLNDEWGKITYPSSTCQWFVTPECGSGTGTLEMHKASRNYLVGPMVEVHLPLSFSIEADALYHPLSLAVPADARLLTLPSIATFNSWEFPVVGKYRFAAPFARPYLEAGPTFRSASSTYGRYLSKAGITAGIGVEATLWRMRIAPGVRFVHWGHDAPDAGFLYPSKRNQAEFLLGLSY